MVVVYGMASIKSDLYLTMPRLTLIAVISWPLALLYLWLGNAPPSLLRAVCMLSIFVFWLLRKTIFNGVDLFCAALLAILIYNPFAIFDTGAQLSFLCIAVIAIAAPVFKKIFARKKKRKKNLLAVFLRYAGGVLLISLLIQLTMLPLSLSLFSIAGLWFPLNVIWLPALGFFVLPIAALALILTIFPFSLCHTGAALLIDIAALPCGAMLSFLEFLRGHGILAEPAFMRPHWSAILAFALIAIACAYFFSNKPSRKVKRTAIFPLLCALGLLACGPAARLFKCLDKEPGIEALDVGQGLSLLLSFPGGRALYDGGGSNSARFDPGKIVVAPYLNLNAPPRIDAVFNSHPDLDHLGGLFHILENFQPAALFHNNHDAEGEAKEKWRLLRNQLQGKALYAGDIIYLGDQKNNLRLEVLHPPLDNATAKSWQDNSASLVLRLCKDDTGLALFTGDAEKDTLNYLLKTNANIRAQVVFAPHHGSDRSFIAKFYQSARPKIVIAGCGAQNRYNYPNKKLKSYLAQNKIQLFNTGEHGKIRVRFNANNDPEIKCIKEPK